MYHIARVFGAKIEEVPVVLDNPELLGAIQYDETKKPVIFVKSTEHIYRRRFIVAHELGHHIFDHGNQTDTDKTLFRRSNEAFHFTEIQANNFATTLLMPDFVVNYLVYKDKIHSFERLARILGVTEVAMLNRLKSLGWLPGL